MSLIAGQENQRELATRLIGLYFTASRPPRRRTALSIPTVKRPQAGMANVPATSTPRCRARCGQATGHSAAVGIVQGSDNAHS